MRGKITTTAIAVLLLTGFAVEGQAQLSSTTGPYGATTGGSSSKKKPAQSDSTAAKPGVDAFGSGDASSPEVIAAPPPRSRHRMLAYLS